MSVLPAETSERFPARTAVRPGTAGLRHRAERRVEEAKVRRARRRWATFSVAVLASSFALTVGILDVLH